VVLIRILLGLSVVAVVAIVLTLAFLEPILAAFVLGGVVVGAGVRLVLAHGGSE
jgi:hypothetical protein